MANDIVAVVERLIAAENSKNKDDAARELAADFTQITRMTGVEQRRDEYVKAVADPPPPERHRQLEPDPWVRQSGDLAVVRSVVETTERATPPATARFRNIHVLTREGGAWKCLAWQVTKLA